MNSGDIIDAFPQVQKWTTNMIESISQDSIGPTSTAACVQFSGFSSLGRVESGRSLVVKVYSSSKLDGQAEKWTIFWWNVDGQSKVTFSFWHVHFRGSSIFWANEMSETAYLSLFSMCTFFPLESNDWIVHFHSIPSTFNSTLYFWSLYHYR